MNEEYPYRELREQIIGAAIEVHRTVGPGLLESAYQAFLAEELTDRKIPFLREVSIPVEYKSATVDCGYRLDFMVDNSVIVELKSIDKVQPIHESQLLTYLKVTGKRIGLLINFNVPLLKHGITRKIN